MVSGLDELDQQAADADEASFEYAVKLPEHHPSVQHPVTVPGPRPDSPPLEPAKLEEGGKLMEVPRVNETSR